MMARFEDETNQSGQDAHPGLVKYNETSLSHLADLVSNSLNNFYN